MSELEIWNELGNIYYNTGAYDEAIRTYQKAIELGHGCGQSYSNLASIYILQGHYIDAIPLLQKGIDTLNDAKSKACLWNQMGEAYRKLKDSVNATGAYRKAADLDPENIAFQDNLVEAEMEWRPPNMQFSAGNKYKQPPSPESFAEERSKADREETDLPGTAPEILSSYPETADDPETDSACWVFKDAKLTALIDEDSSDNHDPAPVILGSRVLSYTPGQDDAGSALGYPKETNAPGHEIAKTQPIDRAERAMSTDRPEAGESSNERAHGLLRLGILHWRKKEYERAIRFLELALDVVVRPRDNFLEALCYNTIALIDSDLGKTVDAIQAFQSAASLAPERIFPWNNLGNLNCILGRYDDALAAFREGVEHNSKDPVSWNGLGDMYHKLGRYEDAIAAYQLGNVFENQPLGEDALKEYEIKMEASQQDPRVWNEAGNIYYETGAYEDAIASYRKAIELDPTDATFQTNLARADLAMGLSRTKDETPNLESVAEADREARAQRELDPIKPVPSDSTGAELVREFISTPKRSPYQQGKNASPDFEVPYWVFETDSSSENVLQPAKQYSTIAVETATEDAKSLPVYTGQPHNSLAASDSRLSSIANDDASALTVQLPLRAVKPIGAEEKIRTSFVKNGWKYVPSETNSKVRISPAPTIEVGSVNPVSEKITPEEQKASEIHIDNHVLEGDIAAYQKVTEINPNNDRAWDSLGNMYESAGLHPEAIAAFERAIALDPRKEAYHYHLAIALGYQTQYEKAIQALQDVIALNPNYVLAHCALGSYYRRMNKETEAQEHIAIARPSMEYEKEYNRACFESISGNTDQAFALLETAIEKDQVQETMLRSDPDLDFIRNNPRFEALFSKFVKDN